MSKLVRVPALFAIVVIRIYQRTVARVLPARCRFHPTCSEYAAQAIDAHGLVRGGVRAAWRLLRCGPWTAGGLDPVRHRDGRPEAARG